MGFGDVLYAAGVAQKLYAEDPSLGPVAICDCHGKPRWREEWSGNPAISPGIISPGQRTIRFGGGCLPYHPWHRDPTWRAQDHRGTLYLTDQETALGASLVARYGPFVLVEPGGSDRKNSNRYWPHWRSVVPALKAVTDLPILQLTREHTHVLAGTTLVPHQSFREACAIVAAADAAVLTEGGITAGAAAVGTPAVVLYGGCIDPDRLGYPEHVNLATGPACWSTKPCPHCAAVWATITPETVAQALVGLLPVRDTLRAD